jgi:predicted oxidoreductase
MALFSRLGTFDYLLEHSIRPQVWAPLAGGRLFANTLESFDPAASGTIVRLRGVLQGMAEKYNVSQECVVLVCQ